VQLIARATFTKDLEGVADDGTTLVSRITAYFHSRSTIVNESQPLDIDELISYFNKRVDEFNRRGSGYILASIDRLTLSFVKYRPLGDSSYIPTPAWLRTKRCVVNVQNDDEHCFVWAVLSALFPVERHSYRTNHYVQYEDRVDVTGLTFPLPPNKISVFENNNPSTAVHCLSYDQPDQDTKSFVVTYLSPEAQKREHTITLLLLDSDDNRRHYVWVKNLSALISDRDNVHHKLHVCLSCLQVFTSASVLNEHSRCCLIHKPQQTKFPDENDPESCKLSFRSHHFEFPFTFYFVADFNFLKPVVDGDQQQSGAGRVINVHEPSGFCLHRVSSFSDYQTSPYTYSGVNVIDALYDHVLREARSISDILSRNVQMCPLDDHQQSSFDAAVTCHNCNTKFTGYNPKTRHHCHVTGNCFRHVTIAIWH